MLCIRIKVEGEPARNASFEDVARVRFGRALDNDLVLDAPYVSRYHGEFLLREGSWYVRDAGSRSGTGLKPPHTDVTHRLPEADVPLRGGETLVIHSTQLGVEIKAVDDWVSKSDALVVSRLDETRLDGMRELEEQVRGDARRMQRLNELSRALNAPATLDETLGRIGEAIFDLVPKATNLALCAQDESGDYRPSYSLARDGDALAALSFPVSQSIIGMAVERGAALRFDLTEDAPAAASVIAHAIASAMAVPLHGSRKALGVLVVDNRGGDRCFSQEDLDLVVVLSSTASLAIERAELQGQIEAMFEGFVGASVSAIEARDPTTSGHSRRVARLAVSLAEAVGESGVCDIADRDEVSREGLTELAYASLLHDFGKVGVPECVLVKATKLYPEQLAAIEARFALAEARHRNALLRDALTGPGAADPVQQLAALDASAFEHEAELCELLDAIRSCDRGAAIEPAILAKIERLSVQTDADASRGAPQPLLTSEDFAALAIERGTLTDAERAVIETHVSHSYRVLRRIPWPDHLAGVPEIVHAHHEKVDGSGYPLGLAGDAIPYAARALAVCDIFDAITASDRPYREAMSVNEGLAVLEAHAQAREIDADLVAAFIATRAWERPIAQPQLAALLAGDNE